MELANLKSENLASKNSIKMVVECLVQMKGMNASSSGKGYTPLPPTNALKGGCYIKFPAGVPCIYVRKDYTTLRHLFCLCKFCQLYLAAHLVN